MTRLRVFLVALAVVCLHGAAVAQDDAPLAEPLWAPLSEDSLSAAMNAVAGCDGRLRQQMGQEVSPEDLAKTCSLPLDATHGRLVVETGRLTGLLELCGAPDRNIYFAQAMKRIEALPYYSAEIDYYAGSLHGFARGMSRNALSGAGICSRNDPGESRHYQSVAGRHFRQFVLPAPGVVQ